MPDDVASSPSKEREQQRAYGFLHKRVFSIPSRQTRPYLTYCMKKFYFTIFPCGIMEKTKASIKWDPGYQRVSTYPIICLHVRQHPHNIPPVLRNTKFGHQVHTTRLTTPYCVLTAPGTEYWLLHTWRRKESRTKWSHVVLVLASKVLYLKKNDVVCFLIYVIFFGRIHPAQKWEK